MRYIHVVEEGPIRVMQGMDDFAHSDTEMSITEALAVVNKFNIGAFHPDVYVITPNHKLVVINSRIVGFVSIEDLNYEV